MQHEYEVKIFLDDEEDEALKEAARNASKTPTQLLTDLAIAVVVQQVQNWLGDKLDDVLKKVGRSQAYRMLKGLVD